ncbi:DUF1488 domain-containing protein [Robbsia sp. KACC 23696]|uniref:DUF1488 domain-containing protein n=1 Tax=Robbsia sp. KACC 23696 TaxID=3149231 RepID=UPI00325B7D30
MDCFFPNVEPEYHGSPPEVRFLVRVDGAPVICSISAEALQDHFDAHGPFEDELLHAFVRGRQRISAVCIAALRRSHGDPVVLRSGMFRFAEAAMGKRYASELNGRGVRPAMAAMATSGRR